MTIEIKQSSIKINTVLFSGGEVHVQLDDLPEQAPQSLNIRANIQSSDDLMALLLTHNALLKQYSPSLNINLEIPYFPYARQDRVCAKGQAFSLEVMAKLVNDLNCNQITVWDAHSPVTEELIKAKNIPQAEIIASCPALLTLLKASNSVLVCPDKGAVKKCEALKEQLSINEMIQSEKVRDPRTGKIVDTQIQSGDLKGKTAIIVDDICDGGRTFIEIAKKLKEKNVDTVVLYVTHGIFSKGLEVFDGLIDQIYMSDSFTNNNLQVTAKTKLTVINYSS